MTTLVTCLKLAAITFSISCLACSSHKFLIVAQLNKYYTHTPLHQHEALLMTPNDWSQANKSQIVNWSIISVVSSSASNTIWTKRLMVHCQKIT